MSFSHIMLVVGYWLAVVACGALGVFGVLAALMSPMMFDAPGSTKNVSNWIGFASVLCVPVAGGVGMILSLRSDAWPWAFGWLVMPLIPVAVLLSLMWIND